MSTLIDRYLKFEDKTKIVLTTFSNKYTIEDFDRQIANFIDFLEGMNIKGKRVAILVPNVFSYLTLTMAVNHFGGIIVPLSWQYRNEDLKEILGFVDPHIVFTIKEYAGFSFVKVIEEWANSNEQQTTVFKSQYGFDWEQTQFGKVEKKLEEEDIVFICTTSGSTGVPKALMLKNESIEYAVDFATELYGLKSTDRMFTTTPPTVLLGVAYLFTGLHKGLEIVYPDSFDLPLIVNLIKETKTNKILVTPSVLKAIFTFAKQMDPNIINNWEFIMTGGEVIPDDISEQVLVNDECKFLGGYGNSETGGTLYCDLKKKRVYSLFRGAKYQIASDGEFLLRTPGTFAGYYKQPQLTSEVLTDDGWFKTGDLVRNDEDGNLEIIGRKKDLIKKGGLQVVPGEVEKILLQHPKVKQAVVLGAPHTVFGEQVVAFVTLEEEVAPNEISAFCVDRIARYKVPDTIQVISELPFRQGKVDKMSLRDSIVAMKGVKA